ncbi:MAG: carbohydrate kinase [Pseudomonadota bacterium]
MILCCGEALIDMLPRQTQAGEAAFAPYAGGAVFNTAIALGRLGAKAGFFSGLSRDLFGQILQDGLAASGVDARHAALSDRPTTLAFVTLTDGQARYAFYDEGTAGRCLSPDDLPRNLGDTNALFFGGISLAVEPCAEAYEALLLRESPGRAIMIDPNIRPGFITDEDSYRARLARMLAASDIIKLSDEDLHWLKGAGATDDLAESLLEGGASLVLITEGADGATGYTGAHRVKVPARSVEVIDTVGAGDTFNAGVMAALELHGALTKGALPDLSEDQIRAAITLGIRAAAVTVSRAGANPPWAKEL